MYKKPLRDCIAHLRRLCQASGGENFGFSIPALHFGGKTALTRLFVVMRSSDPNIGSR